jgi:hypothetical protein
MFSPYRPLLSHVSRFFSSSKETILLRQNLLSPKLMEVLQILKHIYKDEMFDFTSHLVASEEDYSIAKATEAAIHELTSLGQTEELLDLLSNDAEESEATNK